MCYLPGKVKMWEANLLTNDDGEGIFESEQQALFEYGVKSID